MSTTVRASSWVACVVCVVFAWSPPGIGGDPLGSQERASVPARTDTQADAPSSAERRLSMVNILHEARSAYLAADTETLSRLADMHGDDLVTCWRRGESRSVERQLAASTIAYLAPAWGGAKDILHGAEISRRMGFLEGGVGHPWEGLEVCFLPAATHNYVVKRLQTTDDPEIQLSILQLLHVIVAAPAGIHEAARRIATSSDNSDKIRVKALFLLAKGSSDISVRDLALQYLTDKGSSSELRLGAFKALSYMSLKPEEVPLPQMRYIVNLGPWLDTKAKWGVYAQILRVDPENAFVNSEFARCFHGKDEIGHLLAMHVLARYEARPSALRDWLEAVHETWNPGAREGLGLGGGTIAERFAWRLQRERREERRAGRRAKDDRDR